MNTRVSMRISIRRDLRHGAYLRFRWIVENYTYSCIYISRKKLCFLRPHVMTTSRVDKNEKVAHSTTVSPSVLSFACSFMTCLSLVSLKHYRNQRLRVPPKKTVSLYSCNTFQVISIAATSTSEASGFYENKQRIFVYQIN